MAAEAPNLDKLAILDKSGSRSYIYPADVKGRFTRLKPWFYGFLMVLYAGMPWIQIGGHPAILFDIPMRRFYLFGKVFNAQDFYLSFFLMTGVGFTLIVISALFGRLWCGWACPQTVFLEGVFRRVERWIEGPANSRRRLAAAPWNADKILRKGAKHAIYVVASLLIAHIFLSYFVPLPRLFNMMLTAPRENWTSFLWAFSITAVVYLNFWWFREQLCLVVCPYGRLQSALQDDETVIIGYDSERGEPRGKAKDPNAGACVDCKRCVVVCPTGIDIRNGLQLECIGCAACIDACDDIMGKLGREKGLVRYDSLKGLAKEPRHFWRPRVFYYLAAGVLGLSVAIFTWSQHKPFEANLLRVQGAPYFVDDDRVNNQLLIHLINKHEDTTTFVIQGGMEENLTYIIPQAEVVMDSFASLQLPIVISVPKANFVPGQPFTITIREPERKLSRELVGELLGPSGPSGGEVAP